MKQFLFFTFFLTSSTALLGVEAAPVKKERTRELYESSKVSASHKRFLEQKMNRREGRLAMHQAREAYRQAHPKGPSDDTNKEIVTPDGLRIKIKQPQTPSH